MANGCQLGKSGIVLPPDIAAIQLVRQGTQQPRWHILGNESKFLRSQQKKKGKVLREVKIKIFLVEVGCMGFVSTSITSLSKRIELKGCSLKQSSAHKMQQKKQKLD